MTSIAKWVMSPLADRVLDVGGHRSFVIGEWTDDGSRPGEPIAPPHTHTEEEEGWYVLEGRLRFRLGDAEVDAPAGTAVIGPRAVPHTYWNPVPHPARYLIVMEPRTWALVQALHRELPPGVEMRELFLSHGVELAAG